MTKDINLVINDKSLKKNRTAKDIRTILEDFVQVKNIKECNILIPSQTQIKYINKTDKGLRHGGVFIKVIDTYLLLKSRNRFWKVSFDKNKIYAKLDIQEYKEKSLFVDYLEKKVCDNDITIVVGGKSVDRKYLVELYVIDTL